LSQKPSREYISGLGNRYGVSGQPSHVGGRLVGTNLLRPVIERLLDIAKYQGFWDIDRATNMPEYLGTQPSSPG
jgi:hypothetical protein